MPNFDITSRVVQALGIDIATQAQGSPFVPDSIRWDCSIGSMPFLLATSDQFPYRRETASFRRDRVDTSTSPGEQSLDSGYWLRSQASWHYGTGLSSAEPLEVSDTEARFRYQQGGGVDPWHPGRLSLLNDVDLMLSSTGTNQQMLGVDTGVLHADGTTVTYVASGGSTTAVTWGGSVNPVVSMTSDGANYYIANSTGIYKGTLPSSAGSLVWNTGSSNTVCRWVKSRLMAAVGPSIYELTTGGPALPTALFTHTNASWLWTDFAEGPAAIYVAGYSGDQSAIYKIATTVSGSTITLSIPVVVADMPRGEKVASLYSYVGSYLVIGTNKGVRVAIIGSDGNLSLGPNIVETSSGSYDAVADGSFVYVTMGSKADAGNRVQRAGLARIDLGTNLNNNSLQFASAADLVGPSAVTGLANQVTTAGGSLWFTITGTGGGVYKQSANYVTEGWLETGRIRMSTIEPKAWREIRVLQDDTTNGTVSAYATCLEGGAPSSWTSIVSTSVDNTDATGSLTSAAPGPQASLYVGFKLSRGASTETPYFIGYQVRSIPAPHRAQLIQVPLMCFDRETDRKGARYGADGGAWARYGLLKQLEQTAATVLWKDNTTGESAEAYIEQVTMTRLTPPSKEFSGTGGVVQVTLRLVG